MSTSPVDLFLVYSFIKRLVLPFRRWDAYKTGVINDKGDILVPPNDRNYDQNRSFKKFDVMVRNMKLLLAKIPGGSSRFATFTAALFLLKEQSEDINEESFLQYLAEEADLALFGRFNQEYPIDALAEDAPVNNVGSGNVAGMNGDGPAKLPNSFILRRKKKLVNEENEEVTVVSYKPGSSNKDIWYVTYNGRIPGDSRGYSKDEARTQALKIVDDMPIVNGRRSHIFKPY